MACQIHNPVGRLSRSRSQHKHVLLPACLATNQNSYLITDYLATSLRNLRLVVGWLVCCYQRSQLASSLSVYYLNSNKFKWDIWSASEGAKYFDGFGNNRNATWLAGWLSPRESSRQVKWMKSIEKKRSQNGRSLWPSSLLYFRTLQIIRNLFEKFRFGQLHKCQSRTIC